MTHKDRKVDMNVVSQRIKEKMSRQTDIETSLEEDVSVGKNHQEEIYRGQALKSI